ncbi:MAG TPA: tetratricopeptide repeat protein [bacterium]|nr:tetratricopeptide repeat protein [bacterium]
MNRIIAALAGIFLAMTAATAAFAQAPSDNFYKGNIAYEKGDYAAAIANYERMLGDGSESANLYYNLGNAYYKSGNTGKSILYYEKALKLRRQDADAAANLAFVRSSLEDRPEEARRNWLVRRFDIFMTDMSLDGLTILCAVLWWVTLLAGTAYLFMRDRWIAGRKYLAVSGAVCLTMLAILLVRIATVEYTAYGIVLDKEVEVKYGPTEGDAVAFTLHEGSKVRIESAAQDWVQVSFAEGKAGWVRRSAVGII